MIIPFAKFEVNNKYKIFKSFSITTIPNKLILYFQKIISAINFFNLNFS